MNGNERRLTWCKRRILFILPIRLMKITILRIAMAIKALSIVLSSIQITTSVHLYIPDSERLNWSGVLSPDNNRVAFLSLPENSIEAGAELYITSIHEGDPISVPIIPCENSLLDASNLTYFDLFYSEAQYELYLLDWR